MPASDIVHHCAGVSGANCHLFFPVFLMRRVSEKHHNTLWEEWYDQSCQPVLEIIKAYTLGGHVTLVLSVMLLQYAKGDFQGIFKAVCVYNIPYIFYIIWDGQSFSILDRKPSFFQGTKYFKKFDYLIKLPNIKALINIFILTMDQNYYVQCERCHS